MLRKINKNDKSGGICLRDKLMIQNNKSPILNFQIFTIWNIYKL